MQPAIWPLLGLSCWNGSLVRPAAGIHACCMHSPPAPSPVATRQIMDKHLALLAGKHLETKFVRVHAEKAPFLTGRLEVRGVRLWLWLRWGRRSGCVDACVLYHLSIRPIWHTGTAPPVLSNMQAEAMRL